MNKPFQNLGDVFEEMLGDIKYDPTQTVAKLPFLLRVGLPYRRPPRHNFFDIIREMGVGNIDNLFNGYPFNQSNLVFVFPERWTNVSEQQAFTSVLSKHPDIKNVNQVDLITHCPLIISGCTSEMIRILKWDDDIDYDHQK